MITSNRSNIPGLKPTAKQLQVQIQELKRNGNADEQTEVLNSLYHTYVRSLKAKGLMDFDDLLCNTIDLLTNNPNIKNDFDAVLVDEYHDTSKMFFQILTSLCADNEITVVGGTVIQIFK